eukprot:2212050-Prymnesium_polylepis.1
MDHQHQHHAVQCPHAATCVGKAVVGDREYVLNRCSMYSRYAVQGHGRESALLGSEIGRPRGSDARRSE